MQGSAPTSICATMTAKKFTRSEMFSLVWSAPMRSVAAELGLSDVGLKKAVRKAGIPTPPQGYWNRVAAGRKVEPRPTLPPRGFGASDDIWIGGNYWQHHEPPPGPNDPAPIAPTFDESMESVRKRVEKAVGKVARARDLSTPHPAIGLVIQDEADRAEKMRTARWPSSSDAPRFDSPLDQRRLRLLNAICYGVAKAGVKAQLWRKEEPVIHLETGAVSLPLIARKLISKGKNAATDKRLSIVVGGISGHHETVVAQWDDTEGRKLETMLTEMAVELIVLMEQRYRDSRVHHHEWLIERQAAAVKAAEQARIEAENRERERIKKLEQERVEQLLADADQLRQAQAIRAYVAEVAELYGSQSAPTEGATFHEWRAWALAQADRIDPVKNGRFLKSVKDRN